MTTSTETRATFAPRTRQPLEVMLRLAEAAGCDLRPRQTKPHILQGQCPFHAGPKNERDASLIIDTRSESFRCWTCDARGDTPIFAALAWGIAVSEANRILEATPVEEISLARPTPMAMREPEKSRERSYRQQNTFALSNATDFYMTELAESNVGLSYLARLGFTAADAREARVGFSKGWGLRDHLEQCGASPEEIEESPLFRERGEGRYNEDFHATLMIPELDFIRATRWLIGIPATAPESGEGWPDEAPQPLHLRGQRPFMLGLGMIPKRVNEIVVTDDLRVHLVMQCRHIPSVYTLHRRDGGRIAERIMGKQPHSVTLALRDEELSAAVERAAESMRRETTVKRWGRERVAATLEPGTRDMSGLAGTDRRNKATVGP